MWQFIKEENEDLLISREYPEFSKSLVYDKDQADMNKFVEIVTNIRNLRASMNIKPKDEVRINLFCDDKELCSYFLSQLQGFKDLARLSELTIESKSATRPKKATMSATTHTEIFLPLEGVINLEEQIGRLEKELEKTQKEYEKYAKKISNAKFMDNAPAEVVTEVRENAASLEEKMKSIEENLKNFKN